VRNPLIYLDYNATTPVDERVLANMLPWFRQQFGNAASKTHAYGWEAAHAVKKARLQVASLIQASPENITFTSGATEAINLGIKGLVANWGNKKRRLISWPTEHKAVLDTLKQCEKAGLEVVYLAVDRNGLPDLQTLKEALTPDTLLVCGMLANNESGLLWPIEEISAICRAAGVWFLCDATQAVGKINVDINTLGVTMLVGSAHKFYGPKGAGFLYLASGKGMPRLQAQLTGGGHENGLRSGTLNVPAIVGMGAAAEIAANLLLQESKRQQQLRNDFEAEITTSLPAVTVLSASEKRLPNTSLLCFDHVAASALLKELRGFALSMGSACSSADAAPSHVIMAMGYDKKQAESCIRLSIGRETQSADMALVAAALKAAVNKLRAESPAWNYRQQGQGT
jgi:cysteine desulfurase